ncbi:MAG: hypothetical protein ACM336_02500 [Acidobacteriota bacterium]
MADKRYIVSFRKPRSTPHEVDAATVKRQDGRLIFIDSTGEETGNFNDADVMGYSLKPVDDEDDMPPIGEMA